MTWFNPVRTNDENYHKRMILHTAKKQLDKDLIRINKRIEKTSNELREMDMFRDSKAKIYNKRNKLNTECERRDEIEKRLATIS